MSNDLRAVSSVQPIRPPSSSPVLRHRPGAPASWEADVWYRADAIDDMTALESVDTQQPLLVSPAAWSTLGPVWRRADARRGVLVNGEGDLSAWQHALDGLALIAIEFASFTDGRGFSVARQLRRQGDWQGELRAVGDVRIDTLNYLARCGFDAFVLGANEDAGLAEGELARFATPYQRGYRALVAQGVEA